MNNENNIPLATEIIRTLKKIIYFLIILEFLTIVGFLWYVSLPTEQVSIENDSGNANYVGNNTEGVVITNGEDKSSTSGNEE